MRAPHLAKLAALFLPVAVCASSVSAQKMYWITRGVLRADLNGDNFEVLIADGIAAHGIALDLVGEKMYWTSPFDEKLRRANLDGSDVEELVSGGHFRGVAVDESGRKLYFTDSGSIKRADLDGTDIETVLPDVFADAIALNLADQEMYFTTSGFRVLRANLNGMQMEELVTDLPTWPTAIALDTRKRRVYWTEPDFMFIKVARIRRANFDGSNVETVVTDVNSHGIALDDIRGTLYFTNANSFTSVVERVNLDGTERTILVGAKGGVPVGIALDLRGLPIPAVSGWGFVIIALSIVTIQVAVRRRRACVSAPTEGGS